METTIQERETQLGEEIKSKLPEFHKMIEEAVKASEKPEFILLHQDAFAADYQNEEYSLLGKAVKYAGLHGQAVLFRGKNRETLKQVSEN